MKLSPDYTPLGVVISISGKDSEGQDHTSVQAKNRIARKIRSLRFI